MTNRLSDGCLNEFVYKALLSSLDADVIPNLADDKPYLGLGYLGSYH